MGTFNARLCTTRFFFSVEKAYSQFLRLRRILDQARDVARVRGDRTTRVETWYNSNENVVAIGEAAHGWNVRAKIIRVHFCPVDSHNAIVARKWTYGRIWRGGRSCSGTFTVENKE